MVVCVKYVYRYIDRYMKYTYNITRTHTHIYNECILQKKHTHTLYTYIMSIKSIHIYTYMK